MVIILRFNDRLLKVDLLGIVWMPKVEIVIKYLQLARKNWKIIFNEKKC